MGRGPRTCRGCGRPLSLLARPDQLHCSARCRLLAFRARQTLPPDLAQLAAALPPHVAVLVLVAGVAAAASDDWTAAAWLLERQPPERWGPPVTGRAG